MAILTAELKVAGAVWGFCGVFTVGLIRVIATVIHPVTFPNQADAHSVLTLEAELITLLVELGVLRASSKGGILVRAVSALDDPITHHGVEQTLLAVLTYEVHEACTEGLAMLLVGAIRAVSQAVTVLAGWDAGAIRAVEAIALFLTADGIFIRAILAISVTITCPSLGDAVAVVALEVGGLTGVVDGGAVGFIRPVPAVIVSVAHPGGPDAHPRAAVELVAATLMHLTVTLITVVPTVIFKVTLIGERNASPRLLAPELSVCVTDRGGAISLVTHVSTVIVKVTPPNAVDTVAVAAAILVAKTGVLFFDTCIVFPLIAPRAVTYQVPRGEDTAGHTFWTPAASAVVGLGETQEAAGLRDTGIASSVLPFVEDLHVHQACELACQSLSL